MFFGEATVGMSKLYRLCAQRVAMREGPIAEHISNHNAAGTDVAAAVWNEYKGNCRALFSYRRRRFAEEVAQLRSGGVVSLATFGLKDAVTCVNFFARLLACYMAGIMVGRDSILPPMSPGSPLAAGSEYANPNYA